MNIIELMVAEHSNITRVLNVVRNASYGILKGDAINYQDFDQMIDFIKNYADVHHHGKEEKFLFKETVDNLGNLANKLVTHGMLVEHDFGRLYISELTNALLKVKDGDDMSKIDVIANGSLTPTLLIVSHKASNGFIFLSISYLPIARSTTIRYNSNEVII
ncbi:MAG: hemerythrin domain-containing protein [Ruminococcaceae bacterium]|nr:hemerythrin domain-containing protein [Oscillospiraceae bacterium]